MKPKVVWTIAGFDPSSGAGVTADLLTFAAHGLFGCSAITALTVQSTVGVAGVELVGAPLLATTLEHLYEDLPPAGVKIGMLGGPQQARVIGSFLERLGDGPVVLDPVLRSSSGRELYPAAAVPELREMLLPRVGFVTPNWPELALLADLPVRSMEEAAAAARRLIERYPGLHVVATGGDQSPAGEAVGNSVRDLLITPGGGRFEIEGERIATTSTHGTGCAFSAALLAQLVAGAEALEAVKAAKRYVKGALRAAPGVGRGRGPMGLLWNR